MVNVLLALCLVAQEKQADEVDPKPAIKQFQKSLAENPPNALAELGRTPHKKTLEIIAQFLTRGDEATRIAAAKALAGFGEFKKYAVPMLAAAFRKNAKKLWKVQVEILKSLGALGDELALRTLYQNFQNKNVKVAQAAIEATGLKPQLATLDQLHSMIRKVDGWLKRKQHGGIRDEKGKLGREADQKRRLEAIKKSIVKSFQAITGEKWGSALEWDIWFKRRRATFKLPE